MYVSCIRLFSVFAVNALKSRNSSNNAYEELLADINNSKMSDEEILIDLYSQFELLQIQINELGDSAFEKPGKYGKNIMEDYIIYSNAYSNASYIYQKFPDNRRQLVEDALYNISEEKSKTDPNTSVIKSNELVIEKYNRTIDLKFKDTGNIEGVQLFFDNTIWEYAMIVFVVMLAVRMFTMDISCGAYKIIHSSLNGQRSLFIKQFASVSVVVTAITVFTALIQIIFGKIFFDINDLSLPLQSFPEFEFCPYLISTGISDLDIKNFMGYKAFSGDSLKQYYMNDAVIKSFSCAAAALFICAVSIFAKNTVFAFFISFVFIVCPYFISAFFRGSWFEYAFAANQLGAMYSEDLNIYALSVTYILKASLYSGFCISKWGKLQ